MFENLDEETKISCDEARIFINANVVSIKTR